MHRRRYGHRIVTHHPHASDESDRTCGDIEEFREQELIAAYEVTVRSDWKSRLPDFGKKVSQGNLLKYVILATDVRSDQDLYPAEHLVRFVEQLPFDLAIVDITDFFCVFCAELSRQEIAVAINVAYEFLCNPALSGRLDFQQRYKFVTDRWLDS